MKRNHDCEKIQKILAELYPEPAIPLQHKDSFTLLVAVMLSGNSTDAQVNKVTPFLFAKADTPQAMAKMDVADIENIIRPCGLGPQKARAIKEMSIMLLDHFQGHVPDTFEELESLPGVGHKTASVVMSQAFHHDAFPVDTHIHRCAKRWGLSNGKNVKQTEKDLKALFPKRDWNSLHLRIIYFAREYCQARKHDPAECPICSWISMGRGVRSQKSVEKLR